MCGDRTPFWERALGGRSAARLTRRKLAMGRRADSTARTRQRLYVLWGFIVQSQVKRAFCRGFGYRRAAPNVALIPFCIVVDFVI